MDNGDEILEKIRASIAQIRDAIDCVTEDQEELARKGLSKYLQEREALFKRTRNLVFGILQTSQELADYHGPKDQVLEELVGCATAIAEGASVFFFNLRRNFVAAKANAVEAGVRNRGLVEEALDIALESARNVSPDGLYVYPRPVGLIPLVKWNKTDDKKFKSLVLAFRCHHAAVEMQEQLANRNQ